MGKLIALIVIAAVAWFAYSSNIDFNKMKENSIETLKKEKTVSAVNKSRDKNKEYVDRALNGGDDE